jgi:hypothetical protein
MIRLLEYLEVETREIQETMIKELIEGKVTPQ